MKLQNTSHFRDDLLDKILDFVVPDGCFDNDGDILVRNLEVSDITEDLVPGAFLAVDENHNRVNRIMALVFPILFFPFDRIVDKPGYLNVLLLSREEHLV
jgi:hypothetical protein